MGNVQKHTITIIRDIHHLRSAAGNQLTQRSRLVGKPQIPGKVVSCTRRQDSKGGPLLQANGGGPAYRTVSARDYKRVPVVEPGAPVGFLKVTA